MIVEFFLTVLMSFVTFIFDVIPDVPAMPTELATAGDWVENSIADVAGLFSWAYGTALFVAMIAMVIVILNFEHLYYATLWVLRKLPFNSN